MHSPFSPNPFIRKTSNLFCFNALVKTRERERENLMKCFKQHFCSNFYTRTTIRRRGAVCRCRKCTLLRFRVFPNRHLASVHNNEWLNPCSSPPSSSSSRAQSCVNGNNTCLDHWLILPLPMSDAWTRIRWSGDWWYKTVWPDWRNFATLAKFYKSLATFWGFN